MRIIPILGALALAACSTAPVAGPAPAANAALTQSQLAAYAVEGAYSIAAQAELGLAKVATPAQLAAMKRADATAYAWVVTLREEAQAANVVAADLTAGQQAVAALSLLAKEGI